MSAGTLHLTIEKGATYKKKLVWKDSTGTPIDLSGYIARMQVRENIKSTSTLLDIASAPEGSDITLVPVDGEINIYISDEVTAAITAVEGVYDLEMEDSQGDIIKLVRGNVIFIGEVTR